MLEKLQGILDRYNEIERLLTEVGEDYTRAIELSKERSELEAVVTQANAYQDTLEKISETETLLDSEDEEMRSMAAMELDALQKKRDELESNLKSLLVPKDPRDKRNVIMEIRGGTGGDEASIFAGDLYKMYTRYCESKG